MKNRLKLDFTLETAEARSQFISEYLPTLSFVPNEHETNTIADYILWGKDPSGKNPQQKKEIELKKWVQESTSSVEGLLEIPGFQEAAFQPLGSNQLKIAKKKFDRAAALEQCPESMRPVFQDLFKQIDTLELTLNYYELAIGKRQKPPRESLAYKFTDEEKTHLQSRASQLDQYKYLKMRKLLVQLRSQQYDYYDTYADKIIPHGSSNTNVQFTNELEVYPMGLKGQDKLSQKIFSPHSYRKYTHEELEHISTLLWRKRPLVYLDFENKEHIQKLYELYDVLIEEADRDPEGINSAAPHILNTLKFYEAAAGLTDLQQDLLRLKIKGTSNMLVADYLNKKYNKTYNENYISTIYHSKVLGAIAGAATEHFNVMKNVFYPENFKYCIDCGRLLLMDTNNFMKQKKTLDGYAPRCKRCSKIKREKKKQEAKN